MATWDVVTADEPTAPSSDEVEWRLPAGDELPEGWMLTRLSDVCMTGARSLSPQDFPDELFEYYSIPAFQETGTPAFETGERILSNKLLVERRAVLFGKLNPRVLKVWMVNPAGSHRTIASTEFLPMLANDKAVPEFLFYLCHSGFVVQEAKRMVNGSTPSRQRVDPKSFYDITVPLPPLPEQRAIARALRAVQDAIQTRRREVELERERKAALMQRLFTHGTRGEPTKQTEIGEMPESWVVRTLASIATCLDSKRVPVNQTERNVRPGNVPYYGASGQAGWIDDYIFDEHLLLVAEDGENLVSRKLPIAYSIIGKSWVNNHAHVLRLPGANQAFVEYFLNKVDLSTYLGGATRPKLNQAQLMDMRVPFPDSREQTHIADALSACDAKQVALEREVQSLSELFGAMLEELMTGRLHALPLVETTEVAEVRA